LMPVNDQRDHINWVVLELTRLGEQRVEDGTLVEALTEALDAPDHPVFIPAATYIRDNHRITLHLMEGYVFVATGLAEGCYFALERDCPYVRKVLSSTDSHGGSVLQVIGHRDIQEMCDRLKTEVSADIDEGMRVRITEGKYRGLIGDVSDVLGEDAFVHIRLRSFEVIKSVPKVFLEPVGEEDDGA